MTNFDQVSSQPTSSTGQVNIRSDCRQTATRARASCGEVPSRVTDSTDQMPAGDTDCRQTCSNTASINNQAGFRDTESGRAASNLTVNDGETPARHTECSQQPDTFDQGCAPVTANNDQEPV